MNQLRMSRSILGALVGALLVSGTAAAQGSMSGGAMPKKDAMAMDKMRQDDAMHAPGMLQGADGRMVSGHLMMAMKDGHSMVQLGPDFKIQSNKNIDVVLSPDMMYSASASLMLGKLEKSNGKQEFMVPAGAMTDKYSYALLRDRTTGAVVGMAKLPAMGMRDKDGMAKQDGMMKKPGGSLR